MDKRLVTSAAKKLELMDMTIVQQSIDTDQDSYAFGSLRATPIEQQDRRVAQVEIGEYKFDESELTTVIVNVGFGVRLVEELSEEALNLDDPKVFAEISATIRIEYAVIGRLPSEKALQEFADYNAVHNAYPFWREIVFSLSNRAKLPTIFVPLYRDAEYGHVTRNVIPNGHIAKRRVKKRATSKGSGKKKRKTKKKKVID